MKLLKQLSSIVIGISLLSVLTSCTPGISSTILDAFINSYGEFVEADCSDQTPPIVSIIFDNPNTGERIEMVTGDEDRTFNIHRDDRFFVVFAAEDPEGIKELKIYPGGGSICEYSNGLGRIVFHDYITIEVENKVQCGETTSSRLWHPNLVVGGDYCSSSAITNIVTTTFWAEGTNFGGQTSHSPTIIFSVLPDE